MNDFESLFYKTQAADDKPFSNLKSASSRSKHKRSNSWGNTKKSKRSSLERIEEIKS